MKPVLEVPAIPAGWDVCLGSMSVPTGRHGIEALGDDLLEDDRHRNSALHTQDGELLIELRRQGDRPSDTVQGKDSWSRQEGS